MHHGNSRPSIRSLIITMAAILAIAGVIIGLTARTSHTANTGCWAVSQDGSVVTEEQVGQVCTDTSTLSLYPQDGGTYANEPGPVAHGPLLCSATPVTGANTVEVWVAEGSNYTAEGVAFCHFMQHESGMTVQYP